MKERTKDERQQYEEKVGISFNEGSRKVVGFLTNLKTKGFRDKLHDNEERMAILCFFQSEDGQLIKCMLPDKPYFYVGFEYGTQKEVQSYLQSKLQKVQSIQIVQKIDLEETNHLSGRKKQYLKINFCTIRDLTNAKTPIKSIIDKRKKNRQNDDNPFYANLKQKQFKDVTDFITSMREYDVPFHSRVCIDKGLRAGKWYEITLEDKFILQIKPAEGQRSIPQLKILSFDIQTSKDPLKFPDAEKDEIMMISLMYEGQAFLIINKGFCGDIVKPFDYEPKPQFKCHVTVFNQINQKQTLLRFANFIQNYNPNIITTYNGDKFDYPYIQRRCELNFIKFTAEMGVSDQGGQFYGSHISHLDCFCWVQRDAYLPQGSRGLKAVAKSKLNYDPIEVDPEQMVWLAKNSTQKLAQYSVSDAVATYFLYLKHIHSFIYALATIIPMFPDQVLRKGSGTLCQNLLMAQAFNRGIIFPNKKIEDIDKFYKGNLLDTQTYTGGKVQCLRTGVYRADFATDFSLQPNAFQQLVDNVQEIIRFSLKIEMPQQDIQNITNLSSIKSQVIAKLQALKNIKNPHKYEAYPLIYHIDVAAMYPNIILTNRLQPVSIVNDQICSGCLFNQAQNRCKRQLQWEWRGTSFPLNQGQYMQIRQKIIAKGNHENNLQLQKAVKAEVKAYSQRIYKKTHTQIIETRSDIVCMRQNSFYVDTVRAFRDRRYQYKHLAKSSQNKYKQSLKMKDNNGARQAQGLMILYESMQLAHKIILNSFYGYVMRKGARWYSMEMAAMVTYLGSNIISDSRNFIEGRIGKPLQLDTDGIWMLLPHGFPEDIKFSFKSGKTLKISYPCYILNHLIYEKYSNDQYQWLQRQEQWKYGMRKEMTIFFEIDGPYKAMMIPAAKEKQKTTQLDIQQHHTQLLKKRYVVFNFNGKIKEFKGFQMKRRGQLRITKVFQQQIFPQYLQGTTLKQCYAHCASIAKKYLAIIQKKGQAMDTHQILDYLQQSRVLSRDLNDYGISKGVALSSARRLAQFLGPEVVKGKGGLCCYFVISRYPQDRPVAERAIPTQIFDAQLQIQRQFLIKWTKNDTLLKGDVDIRNILDWDYYFDRLSSQIQKMVCIPAVLQGIQNPIPQIQLPQWLQKKTFDMKHHKQQKILNFLDQKFIKKTQKYSLSKEKESILLSNRKNQEHSQKNQSYSDPTFMNQQNQYTIMGNFKNWLSQQKKIWKEKKSQNINEQFRFAELKSILQITPQKTAGNFNVWYWSGSRIQQLLLTFNRVYYSSGKGTKKAPRQQGQAIQIITEQETFQKQQHYFSAILGTKFYQTKLPLLTSLIMKKGNLWKTAKKSMTYKQQQIQQVFGQYLPDLQRYPIPFVYLVHQKVIGRSIWALIIPKYHQHIFLFVDKSKGSNQDELLKLARKILKNRNQLSAQTEKLSFQHYTDDTQAAKAINKKLIHLMNQMKQKFLVLLKAESIINIKNLGVDFLQDQGPVLLLEEIKIENVSILDWQKKALKTILENDNQLSYLHRLIQWARYSQIPLCNLQTGSKLLDNITNVQLGRLLHSGDQITWWNQYNSDLITTYQSLAFTGKIVNPGIFSNYCIEIAMQNLAVNTIAIAEDLGLQDRETAGLVKKNNNVINKWETLDQMSQVKKAFEYMRKLVKLWVRQFEQSQSYWANELLKHFHKWISTQSGALYDPLLARLVNQLMKKVFHLLAKRLQQLGMHLVYANFTKILVATQKHTPAEARSCIDYALKKCVQQNQKIFKYIGLTPCEDLYKVLAFKDQFNFIGILQKGDLYYKLSLSQLLSPPIAKYYKLLLVHFVQKLAMIQDELLLQFGNNRMQLFLDYQKLLQIKLKHYLQLEFNETLINVLRKLHSDWLNAKEKKKHQQILTDYQSQEEQILSKNGQEQEQQNDSFIDDGEVLNEEQEVVEHQNPQIQMEWKEENKLQTLVQNIISFLNSDPNLRDYLFTTRKNALLQLKLQPSLDYGLIKPIYPKFQLPCSNCYLVNQQPGECQHCGTILLCDRELERSVWKMIQQQGRDLYCDRCNRIKQDFLRKCGCGGKWILKEFPLNWIPYKNRQSQPWSFVNKVFEFMGIL